MALTSSCSKKANFFKITAYSKNTAVKISVLARTLVALIGGFVLANLSAIIISQLLSPNNATKNTSAVATSVDHIVAGMMISFIIYALVVIYAFSTKTARIATFMVTAMSGLGIITTMMLNGVTP